MERESFIKEVERRLQQVFSASRDGYQVPPVQKHRLEGFMQASVFLGLVSNNELQQLMEATHLAIFGKTIEQRKQERPPLWRENAIDYRQYEPPAFGRRNR